MATEVLSSQTLGPASLVWPHQSQSAPCLSPRRSQDCPDRQKASWAEQKSAPGWSPFCHLGPRGTPLPPLPAGHWKGEERLTGWKEQLWLQGAPPRRQGPGLYRHPPAAHGEREAESCHLHRTKKKVEAPKKVRNMPRATHLESGREALNSGLCHSERESSCRSAPKSLNCPSLDLPFCPLPGLSPGSGKDLP